MILDQLSSSIVKVYKVTQPDGTSFQVQREESGACVSWTKSVDGKRVKGDLADQLEVLHQQTEKQRRQLRQNARAEAVARSMDGGW
jgi:hypothetical protein